jgi:acetyl-CoA acetyltransferase
MLHGTRSRASGRSPKAGLSWDDIAVIEVNEAFACVVLQFSRTRASTSAGSQATSTRTAGDLTWASARRDRRPDHGDAARGARPARGPLWVASMCIGQGQAIAAVLERL